MNAARLHRREQELVGQLRETVEELDTFVYSASHDLQEPLRTIIGFCGMLRADLGEIPERADESLGFICDGAERMRNMVLSLLALSRARRRALVMEDVSLQDCADKAAEALVAAVEEAGATITKSKLPTVRGDAGLLGQLYQNLIGNALKFRSEAEPMIHLSADTVDGEAVFGVKDNGVGIDSRYAERVFEPFKRLRGTASREGSGIGLSICRRIVKRHGGRIWVESAPGEGSHFRFTLPVVEGDEA